MANFTTCPLPFLPLMWQLRDAPPAFVASFPAPRTTDTAALKPRIRRIRVPYTAACAPDAPSRTERALAANTPPEVAQL